jgi:hypothetical protein
MTLQKITPMIVRMMAAGIAAIANFTRKTTIDQNDILMSMTRTEETCGSSTMFAAPVGFGYSPSDLFAGLILSHPFLLRTPELFYVRVLESAA